MKRLYVAVFLALCALPALAADPAPASVKIDFTQVLYGRNKKPFTECVKADEADRNKCAETITLTLGWLASAALDQPKQGQPVLERTRRGKLAFRVFDARAAELTSAEIATIVEALGELSYRNTAIAAAVTLLDPVAAAK